MHSLLENYLAEVRAKLGALPLERREEEMREMRQHLLSAMEANQELGQSEDEAAANTLAEFGTVEEASDSVLWSWRRESRKTTAKALGIGVGIWTVFHVYQGIVSYPAGTSTWVLSWIATLLLYAGMFGFLEAVNRMPLGGNTPIQAPSWLKKRLR